MGYLINFLAEYKETIDFIVLALIILIQWPVFLIDKITEDGDLRNRLGVQESISLDNMLLVIFGFLGFFAIASKLIDKAIEVYGIKHSLSTFGFAFLSLSFIFYFFVTYLFVSLSVYTVILYVKAKRLKAETEVGTENKNVKV